MRSISIRNVPDHVYDGLRNMAKANRRSLQEQIKFVLEQEIKLSNKSFLANAAEWREKLRSRDLGDVVESVREDRER